LLAMQWGATLRPWISHDAEVGQHGNVQGSRQSYREEDAESSPSEDITAKELSLAVASAIEAKLAPRFEEASETSARIAAVLNSFNARLHCVEAAAAVAAEEASCGPSLVEPDRPQGHSSRSSSNISGESRLRRIIHTDASKEFLRRGFVVNFRRLIELQKVFAIIHELIKSTAIAALTLVSAGNVWELSYSVMFVVILFVIYGFHAAHYDTMDISNYRNLAELLEDDHGVINGRRVENPNRLLKALQLARTGRRKRTFFILGGFASICTLMWSLVICQWHFDLQLTGIFTGFLTGEFYATLLLVGTLMLIFHTVFEWLYWRETQCVMPARDTGSGEPWNPHKHGIPRRYRWFGLPSMWFTSPAAYEDLCTWIQQSKGEISHRNQVKKIFPEEMAIFALNASGACQLRNALLNAKLYSVQRQSFLLQKSSELRGLEKGEEPQALGIELVFFDSQRSEYLQPEEDYVKGQVHVLCKANSNSSDWPSESSRRVAGQGHGQKGRV